MKNFRPADRLGAIPEYIFSRLNRAAIEAEQAAGRPVLSFGAGTPDVKPAPAYSRKLAELVQADDAHLYPGYGATDEFSEALRNWYDQHFGVGLAADELLPLNGAKDGISHLPLALFNQDDEILVPDPGYPAFDAPAMLVGAKTITYDLLPENDFKIDLDKLVQKISDRTRYIWINFPSNPTGQVSDVAELKSIVDFARLHDLFILYDNAYSEITFDGPPAPSILQVEGAKDIAVEIGSFSKAFSFAGLRIGWIAGNKDIIAALAKLKTQMDSGMALPLQGLAAFALNNPEPDWKESMIESYRGRRDIIAGHLESLGLAFELPKGGLYIWARIPDEAENAEAFCFDLLRDRQILLTPGSAFGKNGDRYVRVSYCVNIDKIEDYFKS